MRARYFRSRMAPDWPKEPIVPSVMCNQFSRNTQRFRRFGDDVDVRNDVETGHHVGGGDDVDAAFESDEIIPGFILGAGNTD